MSRPSGALVAILFVLTLARPASAQLAAAKDGPIVYGHHHVNATDVAVHKKFWAETLGGTVQKVGTDGLEIVKFPNVLLFMRAQGAKAGQAGSTVDHLGLAVPDLRAVMDRIRAHGFRIITREHVGPSAPVKDEIWSPGAGTQIAFALGPDDVKVELLQMANVTQTTLHHVHFFGQQNKEMRDWYAKVFGAKPRDGATFLSADLPGLVMNFTQSPQPMVGTAGRALDHIGFEVKNLEAFLKRLADEGMTPKPVQVRPLPALDLKVAFITDPWGTLIELTEGLDKIQ